MIGGWAILSDQTHVPALVQPLTLGYLSAPRCCYLGLDLAPLTAEELLVTAKEVPGRVGVVGAPATCRVSDTEGVACGRSLARVCQPDASEEP